MTEVGATEVRSRSALRLTVTLPLLASLVGVGAWGEDSRATDELSGRTPLGGERARNRDGTIPEWQGQGVPTPAGHKSGAPRPDPFAGERPRLEISNKNLSEHADRLSPGIKALFERFSDYRLVVYPTHRTAVAPDWVYENTRLNIGRARTVYGGLAIEGARAGIPFPVPKTGAEAIWNHLLAWKGESIHYNFRTYVVPSGEPVLATGAELSLQYPYYDRGGGKEAERLFLMSKTLTTAPPFRAGERLLTLDAIDQVNEGRKSWQYLVGQRRIRRVPTVSYDNPSLISSGFSFFDEIYLFNGALDRYEWKLVGKQEMYIPYNTERFHNKKIAEVLRPNFPNPDHVRWELHRVWVVEATLAPGKRHVLPKRRFYLDEDSWHAVLSEGWDAAGRLWHVGLTLPFSAPELPGVVVAPYVIFDLQKGGYVASSLFNEGQRHYEVLRPRSVEFFSPGSLTAEGVR